MVNQNFDQFIKTEAKHKPTYLGSDQESAHKKYKNQDEMNTRSEPEMSVGVIGRDVFDDKKESKS